jgi:hypothetical protein
MKKEDFLKCEEEILNEISCWNGLENEIIKLFCLFNCCITHKIDGQEWVNINYVREKIFNLLIKHPTLISSDAAKMYVSTLIEKEDQEGK